MVLFSDTEASGTAQGVQDEFRNACLGLHHIFARHQLRSMEFGG